MFQELKFRLAALFTLIVTALQFLFSFMFLLHQVLYSGILVGRALELAVVLFVEIFLISIVTFIVGYFFVCEVIKPAEDMFERLEQFTLDASHELKTPLGIAGSSLDLALRTKKYKDYITEAKTYIRKASDLVEKMLELARLDGLQLAATSVSVQKIADRVLDSCKGELERQRIQLVTSTLNDAQVKADDVLLERCLENLIENAIKFNRPDGRIEVTVDKKFVRIANTGTMVPEADLARIFDRFYQSDLSRSAKGYGIGLAIVKKICDLHGWHVSATSDESLTTFTIVFSR
jgi:signal transduction histidine kinase